MCHATDGLVWGPILHSASLPLVSPPWECGSAPGGPVLMAQCRWHGAGGMARGTVPWHDCPTECPHPGQLPGAWAWGSTPRELGLGRDRRLWQSIRGEQASSQQSDIQSRANTEDSSHCSLLYLCHLQGWTSLFHFCPLWLVPNTNRHLCVLKMWNTKATCWLTV